MTDGDREPLAGLLCQGCGMASLVTADNEPRCTACHAPVRLEAGIPILSRHWEAVQSEIDVARQVRPTWYQDEQSPEEVSPWRHHVRKRREYVQRALARHLGPNGRAARLLDLGCGDGNNLRWLSAFAEQSYGSDYNLVRLVRAKAQNPGATIFAADILDFPAADGAFDVVFFNHVIEHIPDDLRALATVHRVLKPGGLLVLGTPNEGAWWWQWAYRRDPASLRSTDHCHFYTGLTVGAKMMKAGLEVLETYYLGWGPPDWRLDGKIRRYRIVDDVFSAVGRVLLPKQASSLYVLATRRQH
jgi:SAM-dependent methyltransferase